jgi:hypothetical protein
MELICRCGNVRRLARARRRMHVADKTQSFARNGADQLLFVAAVAHRFARGVDTAGQGRVRHDPVMPDRRDEIVLADNAVAVLHQINQQIEHLRFDGNDVVTPAELAPVGVKRIARKEESHVAAPSISHGIIKPVSRTNQGKGKALPALPRNIRASKGGAQSSPI